MSAKHSRHYFFGFGCRIRRCLRLLAAGLVLVFGFQAIPAYAANFTLRPQSEVQVQLPSAPAGTPIVSSPQNVHSDNPDVAIVNLDAASGARTKIGGGALATVEPEPCDLAVSWVGFSTADNAIPGFTPDDEVIVTVDFDEAPPGSGAPTSACTATSGNDIEPDTFLDTPAIATDNWQVELLIDVSGDGALNNADVDACDGSGGTVCGIEVLSAGTTTPGAAASYVTGNVIGKIRLGLLAGGGMFDASTQLAVRVRTDDNATNDEVLLIKDVRIEVTDIGTPETNINWSSSWVEGTEAWLKGRTDASEPRAYNVTVAGGDPAMLIWNNGTAVPGSPTPVSGAVTIPEGLTEGFGATNDIWQLTGTPQAQMSGGKLAVGQHNIQLSVEETALAEDLSRTWRLDVDGGEIYIVGRPAGVARNLLPTQQGEFYSITFRVQHSEIEARTGITSALYDWSLDGAAQLDGLVFSNGLTAGNTVTALSELTLSGTPTGDNDLSFTLSVVQTDIAGCLITDAICVAYSDSVDFSNDQAKGFVILRQELPDVLQGMSYGEGSGLPNYATLQVVGIPTPAATIGVQNLTLTRILDDGTEEAAISGHELELPPATGILRVQEDAGATPPLPILLGTSATIPITTVDGAPFPVGNENAGTYRFRIDVEDNSGPNQVASQDFRFRVLPRKTLIQQAPPRVSEDSALTFTVFGRGGVPTTNATTGIFDGNETRDASGLARYTYSLSIDVIKDDGTQVVGWVTNADLPATITDILTPTTPAGFARAASPVTVTVDLNDATINASDDALRPSAGTGLRYRFRFQALDAVSRNVDGIAGGAGTAVVPEESVTIRVVDASGEDTNPNSLNPNRLRQNRYD